MKKAASIFSLFFLFAITIQAQWSVGARLQATGNNIQAAKGIEMITPDFKMMPGFEAGVTARYGFSNNFAVVGEVNYAQRGFRVRESTDMGLFGINIPLGILVDTRVNNISIPLMAQYEFGHSDLKGFIGLGPEVTYATSARIRARSDSFLDFKLLDQPVNLDAINYQRFDLGAVATVGGSYQTGFGEVFVDARFRHGFNDLINLPIVDTNVKSYGFGLGAGVRLQLAR